MDIDGYPEEHELKSISEFDIVKNPVTDLIDYIKDRWQYADCGYFSSELKDSSGKHILKLRMSTAGWSGNESIIEALQKNNVFWMMYWHESKRGGHYSFEIPTDWITRRKKDD